MRTTNAAADPDTGGLGRSVKWLFLGTVLLAISLRAWGVDFGLPYIYHPDEPPSVAVAQNIFKTGDLNPHFFHHPSLHYYLNALAYVPYYVLGRLAGVFHSPLDIPGPAMAAMACGWTAMPTTFLLGRLLTAAAGLGTVALVFLIGWQLTHEKAVGLLAALMIAISPTHVAHSRPIAPDMFAVFFASLSLWGSVQILRQGKARYYILAGAAAGLAASSKFNGALVAVCLASAHLLRHGRRGLRDPRWCLALIASAIAFVAATPFALLDHGEFVAGLQFDARHYSTGHAGMEGNTLSWYLAYLWQVEGPTPLLAVLGILLGMHWRPRRTALLSVFPLIYFPFIARFVVRNDRTLLPLIPFLSLLASSTLVELYRRASRWRAGRWRPLAVVVGGCAVAVSLALPLAQTVRQSLRLTTVDSRETARAWIDEHLPAGSRIAVESYSPYPDPKRFSVQGFNGLIDHPPGWYVDNQFDYLVLSEGAFGRFFREPDRYAQAVAQYEDLFAAFDLAKRFTDGSYEVRVYRIID